MTAVAVQTLSRDEDVRETTDDLVNAVIGIHHSQGLSFREAVESVIDNGLTDEIRRYLAVRGLLHIVNSAHSDARIGRGTASEQARWTALAMSPDGKSVYKLALAREYVTASGEMKSLGQFLLDDWKDFKAEMHSRAQGFIRRRTAAGLAIRLMEQHGVAVADKLPEPERRELAEAVEKVWTA